MKITRFSALLLLLLVTWLATSAGNISVNQAKAIASRFMSSHAMPTTSIKMVHRAPGLNDGSNDRVAYYVFNASRGYVIVAGDDRAPAVLGYSDHGTFDAQDVPEAMQELLDSYATQIGALEQGAKADLHLSNRRPVTPLVHAAWSQNSPYNTRLPIINGKRAYVGCVATAMAQVMHYWKWPSRPTTAIPAYTTDELHIAMPSLPVVDFQWDLMKDTYLTNDSISAEGKAAATLSLYCAQSVTMDFKSSSSSAYSSHIPNALVNYFGYSPKMKYYQRQIFTTDEWENLIYNELSARRPVFYSGSSSEGGHAFICDGYDGNGLFHINWGWNGQSNGYFLLNVLSPEAQGTGGSSGADGYILRQAIIIGVEPGTQSATELEVCAKYIELQSYTSSRSSINSNFSATQVTHFINYTRDPISFDFGWALYDSNNTMVSMLTTSYTNNLPSNYYIYPTRTLQFGAGISSGTYRIVPMFRERNAGNWRPCLGADINYIEVVINGTSCTMTSHGVSSTPNYRLNDISTSGHMHPTRPVVINVNLTNLGTTRNDVLYMKVNGKIKATGLVDLENGASGNASFQFTSETTGTYNLVFCWAEDGSNVLTTLPVTITAMPSASLSGSVSVLNVTNSSDRIITNDKFSIQVTTTNNGTSTYDEDITVKLYKHIYDNYGTLVQTKSVPVTLARRQSTTVQFDMDNVMDSWRYFARAYYHSSGEEVSLGSSGFYTIVFPEEPKYPYGDVNGDSEVNIADINIIIAIILGKQYDSDIMKRADVDGNGEINIGDANAIIRVILN